MRKFLELMRPYQWVKNIFCFIGVFFGQYYSIDYIFYSILIFIAFCLASSAVYVLNDIMDKELDRKHPIKKNRPIASGEVKVKHACFLSLFLAILAILIGCFSSVLTVVFILIYFIINVLYTLKLKHVVILDVFIIASGFMLRLLAGNYGVGIIPSQWVMLCAFMLTLFLGFAKRKSELLNSNKNLTRKVLDDYSLIMLDIFIAVTASITIVCYSLFTVLGSNIKHIWITTPIVIYGIMRYIYLLLVEDGGQDTAKDIYGDIHLKLTAAWWVVVYFICILY